MATETRPEPLRQGDRMNRAEFERRYDAMPHLKKAELIEGIVCMPSPVSFRGHGRPHFNLIHWLGDFCAGTLGVDGGDNGSIRLDLNNMPQPDAFLIILPEHGGQAQISADDYIEGAPELVAEVASSSASHDLHAKLNAYQHNNVREYVVWRVKDRGFDWFVLRDGRFERLDSGPDGIYRSAVFPGLWLDASALIRGDLQAVARVVQAGLATPEHAAFVEQPRRTKEARP